MGRRACFCSFMLKLGSGRRKRSNTSTFEFVFMCHAFHCNLFVLGIHGWEEKKGKSAWNETHLKSLAFLLLLVIKRAKPLEFEQKKRSRNISSSTPSFVCNGVLKLYFMSLLTYIRCALNNMNYVLRYKLLIPLDFLLWHFNPGIL